MLCKMASLSRVKRKEGYLVKKGHVRHNWKTRWFVLYDERLCYYKKKGDVDPAGYVLLQGCFIVSPCAEYTKKESVFRLTSKEGIEYLIQAVNDEERNSWANSIAEAIRKIEARDRKFQVEKESNASSSTLFEKEPVPYAGSTSELRDIIDAMQDPNAGVPLDNHSCKPENKIYKLCFTGLQLIDWLLKWCFVPDREQGVALCNILLEEAHLQPVGMTSKNSFKRKRQNHKCAFVDESDALYRFSALHFSNNQDVLDLDSSDESSDSDEEMRVIPSDVIKGTIVKQGFLEKKGHVRHNWKTRKFILCTDPPILYYCKPSKGNLPVGQLKLDKCEIKSICKDEELCSSDSFKKSQKYPILLRTRKGVKYVIRAASEMDQLDWIESLQSVCEDPQDQT
ncbi:pleckstrin-2-like [Actinia tenebrosa]|uniref:Pleckstrin-2-like n=1 Tax=Actinia tenebrosa TaxID=6105 RepID=A0A6P8ISK2_ACTTE|nr:pleckstrin-2-like [Actinia tenebrosa]